MKPNKRLSRPEHEFFDTLSMIILSNPFSEERRLLESALTTGMEVHRLSRMELIHEQLQAHIGRLEQRGLKSINQFEGEEWRLVFNAFLYHIYASFLSRFDDVIQRQLQTPKETVVIPFAQELLARTARHGFTKKTGLKYLALFYQLRRAYYFIEKALIGGSASMQQLRESLWNNVFTSDLRNYDEHLWDRMEDFSTLLLGETGTGKGSAASAIGRSGYIPFDEHRGCFSSNFTETFISTNLSSFPEGVIESELFGHRKGAFTGAIDNHKGLFELCSIHGSLFLDEIGDISTQLQLKLLQILQERSFTPVGSHEPKRFSGRVIAATNRSLSELREEKRFRDDFYYRLCSDVITVPPLRQRIEESAIELELLVDLLVERMLGRKNPDLTDSVLRALASGIPQEYSWPGNVRELEQAIRRILLNGSYTGETKSRTQPVSRRVSKEMLDGSISAQRLVAEYCSMLYSRFNTYEAVARRTGLDRRTVKKYLDKAGAGL